MGTSTNNKSYRNIHMRGLSRKLESSIEIYNNAVKRQKKSLIYNSGSSWFWKDPYFIKLSQTKYQRNIERESMIDEYLNELKLKFKNINKLSNSKLNEKLKVTEMNWTKEFGVIPPKICELKKQYNENYEEDINKRKQFDNCISKVIENHGPKVFSMIDNTKDSYIERCIQLIESRNTICVSIDIEAYERQTNIVTEIGISIYDPRENYTSLIPKFRNYHLCCSESLNLKNGRYTPDHKYNYLLGETIVMPLIQCAEFIQNLLNYYLIPQTPHDITWERAIVGHDVIGDIKWLNKMNIVIPGYSDGQITSNIKILDTLKLFNSFYGHKGSGLGKALRLYKIPHSFLHNAGNDAYYTLILLLKMCDIEARKLNGWDDLLEMYQIIHSLDIQDKEEQKKDGKQKQKGFRNTQFHRVKHYNLALHAYKKY